MGLYATQQNAAPVEKVQGSASQTGLKGTALNRWHIPAPQQARNSREPQLVFVLVSTFKIQIMAEFKNLTEEICARRSTEGYEVQRKRQSSVNQWRWRRRAGEQHHMIVPLSFSFLSASAGGHSQGWGTGKERFLVCPDRAVLVLPAFIDGHCGVRVFYKEAVSPVLRCVFCGSALLWGFFVMFCPAPFLSRTGGTISVVCWWISNIFLILLISEC